MELNRIGFFEPAQPSAPPAPMYLRIVFRLTSRSRAICRIDSPSWCHLYVQQHQTITRRVRLPGVGQFPSGKWLTF